ncbi:PQQ-dependent sugar dehydrogenase [Ornithinimicrobium panacihumi]|uniref:PQQ-dependent sugar dehydrogenase n=1 Tax=Ornithinimicrobium panacihumi TaxID=2008449 RepID=UPI003F8CB169
MKAFTALVAASGFALVLAGCSGQPDGPAGPASSQAAPATTNVPTPKTTETAGETAGGAAGETGTTPAAGDDATTDGAATQGPSASDAVPVLSVEVVMDGLDIPWDVQLLPDGTPLVTERPGRLVTLGADGGQVEVDVDLSEVVADGEGGLMGLAISPGFEQDRTFFLCHASDAGGATDVRVTRWTLTDDGLGASADGVVVEGMPYTTGRHSGCRLIFTPDGDLLVGTGDVADDVNPQDLTSLGGKVLLVTTEGEPVDADGYVEGADPRILTYGHRNVQGLALQPGTDAIWEVEHGPDVDDEVNVLRPGANYGWNPGPGYDEGMPMTDLDTFPDAVEAAWSSGDPTHATSGAVFLDGPQWGAWDGALAVAELKGSGVTVMTVDGEEIVDEVRVPELDGSHGRLRSLTLDAGGALWVTTSNGGDDVVLRVTADTDG